MLAHGRLPLMCAGVIAGHTVRAGRSFPNASGSSSDVTKVTGITGIAERAGRRPLVVHAHRGNESSSARTLGSACCHAVRTYVAYTRALSITPAAANARDIHQSSS